MLGTDAATEQQSAGSGEGDDGVARHGIYECIHQAFKHKTGMRNERGKLCKNYAKRHKHDNHACTHTHTHTHTHTKAIAYHTHAIQATDYKCNTA